MAFVTAQRASCPRKHVGVLIVDEDHRIVEGGYNGAPAGLPECTLVGCDLRMIDGKESCVRTLHAESNALDRAGLRARGCTMFSTVMPCRLCALRIVQAKIDLVIYWEYYESQGTRESAGILEAGRVRLQHFDVPRDVVDGVFALPPIQ